MKKEKEEGRESKKSRRERGGKERFGLVSLFNGISTFVGYSVSKPSMERNCNDMISPIAG